MRRRDGGNGAGCRDPGTLSGVPMNSEVAIARLRESAGAPPRAVAELAAAAAGLLGETAGSGRVTSERTVRYYVSRGVVSPPAGRGASARWEYGHLVELLAARLAQRTGDDLDLIAGRRLRMTFAELEEWVAGRLPAPVQKEPPVRMPPHSEWLRFTAAEGVELAIAGSHPLAGNPARLAALIQLLAREAGS